MPLVERQPSLGVILTIRPLHELGGEGDKPIADIQFEDDKHIGQFPLPRELIFKIGQRVIVTPETTFVGDKGGSYTIYQIAPESKS